MKDTLPEVEIPKQFTLPNQHIGLEPLNRFPLATVFTLREFLKLNFKLNSNFSHSYFLFVICNDLVSQKTNVDSVDKIVFPNIFCISK